MSETDSSVGSLSETGTEHAGFDALLVSFRWHDVATLPDRYLKAWERITRRSRAVGGQLVAWGADRYCYQFDPRDFKPVLKAILTLLSEASTHAVGISQRQLHSRFIAGHGEQCWGSALVVADALASAANPGEILLDPLLSDVAEGALATLGSIPVRIGRERLSAALLLPGSCPEDGYRTSSSPPAAESIPPVKLPPTREDLNARDGEPRTTLRASAPPKPQRGAAAEGLASYAPPKPVSVMPVASNGQGRSLRDSAPPKPMPQGATESPRSLRDSAPPKPRPEQEQADNAHAEHHASVIEDLRAGRADAVLDLASQLRTHTGRDQLARRLEAIASLAHGEVDDGLESLEFGLKSAKNKDSTAQSRAGLAYALGLAVAGRKDEALLQALEALGKARAGKDAKGEHACACFLAQLARAEGETTVAEAWQKVVDKNVRPEATATE